MKKTFLMLGMLALTGSLFAQVNFSKSENWAQILKQAKAENKFIFLDGEATWCKPCKMMDDQVYNNKEVGKLLNDKFISVKVQTDKTDDDDALVKAWYKDAEMLKWKYQLTALPALVFLSPDGELLYRSFGFQKANQFITTVKFATSPEASGFKMQIEAYKKGEKDYPKLPKLIGNMRELLVEDSLANVMVKDYFANYVNKMGTKEEVLTKTNAGLVHSNPGIVKSTDKFFLVLMNTPLDTAEKLMEWPGLGLPLLETLAKKEELYMKLFEKGKMVNANANYAKLEKAISSKYPQINAKKVIDDFGVSGYPFLNKGYYIKTNDWKRFNAFYQAEVDDKMRRKNLEGVNDICWWTYFCKVTDKASLELAVKWAGLNIEETKAEPEPDLLNLTGRIDTKAAIIYKLGRRKEAIAVEQSAVDILNADNLKKGRKQDTFCGGLLKTIEKMKKGEKLDGGYGYQVSYAPDWKLLD